MGVIAPNVSDVFLKAYFQVRVSFVLHTTGCMYCMLVDKFPIIVGWKVVVLWRFDKVAYSIAAPECRLYVCVSE